MSSQMDIDAFLAELSPSPPSTPVTVPTLSTKKKVGRRVSKESICLVCGDVARIINYGALCCQACKTFFRRNASSANVGYFIPSDFICFSSFD